MRIAAYVRVSSEKQREGESLNEQKRAIQAFCNSHSMELVQIYEDVFSAFESDREQFMAAVDAVCSGLYDGMAVYSLDRFSRELLDSERVRRRFTSAGKLLFSVNDNVNFSSPEGVLTFQIRQSVSEFERKKIIQRMYDMRMAKSGKGGWIGHHVPFGWTNKQGAMVPDAGHQYTLRFIRRLSKWTRITQSQIAEICTARFEAGDTRFTPPSSRETTKPRRSAYVRPPKMAWSQSTVSRIVNNKRRSVA